MRKSNERINQSIVISYVSIVFSIITGLLYTPWLIQSLGSSDYAIYSIAISLMSYFILDFGIGASVTRFIARYRAEENEKKVNQLLGIALKIYLIIDFIAITILFIIYFLLNRIYVGLSAGELDKLKVVYIITAIMITCSIPVMPINGVFIAFGRVYEVKRFDLVQKALTVGITCLAIILGKGLYAVVLINAVSTIFINVIKLVSIHKEEAVYPELRAYDKDISKELLTFSGWVAIAMIADKFFFSFEPTLLGIFSNSHEISVFAVASAIEGYVLTFADGLNGIFLPRVTNMVVEKKGREEFTELMIRVGRVQFIIVSVFIIGIITQGRDFITLWFGREYEKSYYAAVIVLIPCFIHLTESIATELVFATNNVRYRALSYTTSSIVNIVVTALLAPKFGALGAAIGISLGFCIGHELILNLVYARKLKLNLKRFFMSCHLRGLPSLAIMVLMGFGITSLMPVITKGQIVVRILLCGLSFLIVLYFTFFNEFEKGKIKNVAGTAVRVAKKLLRRKK